MKKILLAMCCSLVATTTIQAETHSKVATIITGTKTIGQVLGKHKTNVQVSISERHDLSKKNKEYKVTVEVRNPISRYRKRHKTKLNMTEVSQTLKCMNFILKADKTVTPLTEFRTDCIVDELAFSTYSINNETKALTMSGDISAYFNLDGLALVRDLLSEAQTEIVKLKKIPAS